MGPALFDTYHILYKPCYLHDLLYTIRELNNNIRRVVDLYAHLSGSFNKSNDVSSEGDDSSGRPTHKRNRPL
uniref:Protein EARLY FLOWERING 4 domain-containing protein n=1 Tax=Solanum lycopersicum TaxID=4081 RepID=A0A3Q7HCS2_SOLLC